MYHNSLNETRELVSLLLAWELHASLFHVLDSFSASLSGWELHLRLLLAENVCVTSAELPPRNALEETTKRTNFSFNLDLLGMVHPSSRDPRSDNSSEIPTQKGRRLVASSNPCIPRAAPRHCRSSHGATNASRGGHTCGSATSASAERRASPFPSGLG